MRFRADRRPPFCARPKSSKRKDVWPKPPRNGSLVLQIDPRSEAAYLSLADALLELKLFQPASIACQQALIVAPKSAGAYDRFGRACEGLGDRAQAASHYAESLKLRPRDQAISHRLAAVLRAQGQLEAAWDVLKPSAKEIPAIRAAAFCWRECWPTMGSHVEATVHLRKAIAHQPRFPEALNNLAVLERSAGANAEAEIYLRKALAIRPDYAAAWNNLGNLYVELSRIGEAARCYSKAIAIDPNMPRPIPIAL